MATSTYETKVQESRRAHNDNRIAGIVLIGLGLLFLAGQWFNIGALILPILGIGFLAAGIVTRQAGWMVPGGILSGISLGTFLINRPYQFVGAEAEGGLFLLGFAVGWFGIYLFSKVFTRDPQKWVLIPGGIMAAIGALVVMQGPGLQLLQLASWLWPVAMVGIGIYLMFYRRRE